MHENGQIVLSEKSEGITKAKVIVIFEEDIADKKYDLKEKIELGTGRHLGYISDTLFDEDLER